MRRLMTHWRTAAVVLGVAAILAVALWPESVEVDVARVARAPLQVTIDEEGETRVRDRFVVSAPVAGRLQRIDLEPGDPVQRGETVVARLRPAPPALLDARTRAEAGAAVEAARAALGRSRAERARAQAASGQAASELKRQSQLAKSGIVSAEALERARTEAEAAQQAFRAAQFAVASAEHELERAQAVLLQASGGGRDIELRSPVDGAVLKRFRESEAVVPTGEPLLEVGDPNDLEIVTDLLSADAVKVRPGQPVSIEQWGGDRALHGRVRRVEPSGFMKVSALGVEEQRVNVIVDFQDPGEAQQVLGDGYRVEVHIVVWEAPDVVKAPTSSLFRRGDDWAVFVVEEGRARLRPVQIGRRNGLEAQVLDGLRAGERVVVHPADTLADGQRVAPRA
jgi:HlyD family secretion protein